MPPVFDLLVSGDEAIHHSTLTCAHRSEFLAHPTRQQRRGLMSFRTRAFTARLLAIGFLFQPFLTYFSTPMIAVDRTGNKVVICTMYGLKWVDLETDLETGLGLDLPDPSDNPVTPQCSVVKFFQMAGTAVQPAQPVVPDVLFSALDAQSLSANPWHNSLYLAAYSARAPPVS